ncbi:hypothetical protein [uncultured Enterovirga sp.]|uniref:hypothetical protein n=1 Tax=uncultured Enterovirga sp. TaxID=2026352 RepID=UPI0035CA9598
MRILRPTPILALLLLATAVPAGAATETMVDCDTIKTRWTAALRAVEPARLGLAFVNAPGRMGEERVANMPDVDARLTCLESLMTRIELRQAAGDPAKTLPPLLTVAASLLAAFDLDLTPAQAADMVGAMRAEAEGRRDAVSAWGVYEITYTRAGADGRAEFVIDHPEN